MADLILSMRRLGDRIKHRVRWNLRKQKVRREIRVPVEVPDSLAARRPVMFFIPEAGVAPHLAALCILARTLREAGDEVVFARCFEQFERCLVMDMVQLGPRPTAGERADTCLRCASSSLELLARYELPVIDLRTLSTPELEARVDAAVRELPADLREVTFDGIAFGKTCAHSLVLATKIYDFENVSAEHRGLWIEYLRSAIRSYLLADAAIKRLKVSRVVHYDDYALLLGSRFAAQKNGIPDTSVTLSPHRNGDRRQFGIQHEPTAISYGFRSKRWPDFRDLPLSPEEVKDVGDDLLFRFKATTAHSYSPAKTLEFDLRSRLRLDPVRKLIVAYTSSLDESIATRMNLSAMGIELAVPTQPFRDQIDWLAQLAAFVEKSPDLQLVIRVHPREAPNKRENTTSQHLAKLRAALDRPFEHCRVVWPQDAVSSYDLGEAADLVAFSWSSMGIEMGRAGVPAICSASWGFILPHDDFSEWAETPEGYFAKVREMVTRPITVETIARAYRWYRLLYLGACIDLSDLVPGPRVDGLPPFRAPRNTPAVREILVGGKDSVQWNLERMRARQNPRTRPDEETALRAELRRLIHYLFTTQDAPAAPLFVVEGVDPDLLRERLSAAGTGARALVLGADRTHYIFDGTIRTRWSPMAARLGRLLERVTIGMPAELEPARGAA